MPAAAPSWSRTLCELLIAAAVGALLQLVANLLVPQLPTPFGGHGERFAAMVADPFAFDVEGDFPQRVLWPALAWLAGQLGVGVMAFSQVTGGLLLATVFWFCRQRVALVDSLLVAAATACTGGVLVYQAMPCFSDQLTLLVMLLLVHFAARPRVFWPLVVLGALSHEMVFFFTPWLLGIRLANGGRPLRELGWLGGAIALYAVYRLPIHAKYGIFYYFEKNIWVPWGMPAMWALWLLVVLAEFGPLLVPMTFAAARGALRELGGRWGPWLYLTGLLSLMVLAYDVMRFATFVLPPVLLGCLALLRCRGGRAVLFALIAAQVAFYLWGHPIPEQQGGHLFTIVAAEAQPLFGLLLPRTVGGACDFSWQLLQKTWVIALGATVFAALLWWFGRLLANRLPQSPGDDAGAC